MIAIKTMNKLKERTERMTKKIKFMRHKRIILHYCVKNVHKIIVLIITFLHLNNQLSMFKSKTQEIRAKSINISRN